MILSTSLLHFRAGVDHLLGLTISLFSIPACLADPAPIIHYAPVENLERSDVALIDQAEHNIDIAAYVLTDWPVMQALIRAAQRGVKIRIEVRFKRAGSPLMHLKSYQIDGRWLRTGAANFSASGLKRQDNDLLIIESRAAATAFERRFDAIFAEGEALPLASEGQPAE
jgi:phosphatidylserine/phosphatidylglycerophosphate/cardiolipin synthase-like enzyme